MPTDLSTIDLATINAAHGVIVAALRNKVCQWEQESSAAAAAAAGVGGIPCHTRPTTPTSNGTRPS